MHPSPLCRSPMTVTDVEIGHARPARSPDTKAAIAYLGASGATAISVIETEAGCTFRVGTKLLARSVAIFWIMEVDAKPVVALARKIAGNGAGGNAARLKQCVGRFAVYEFLKAVYRVHIDWKQRKTAKRSAHLLASELAIVRRKGMSPIRILIEATLPNADLKQKTRW